MIEFNNYRMEGKRQSTVTAVINDIAIMEGGKKYLMHVLEELVKQSALVHRIEIENMVTTIIASAETKEYIENKIREVIDKTIQEEISEIFHRDR